MLKLHQYFKFPFSGRVLKIFHPDFHKIKKQKLSFLLSIYLIIHGQLPQALRPAFPSGHGPS